MNELAGRWDRSEPFLTWSAQEHESLPALAWLAVCTGEHVTIHHGGAVETFEHGVFEGTWSGSFAQGGYADARAVFGSGVSMQGGDVLFVTPSHTLEALYYQSVGERVLVSNSLAFLLSASDSSPEWDRDTTRRFATAILGIEKYDPFLFDTRNGPVHRVIYDNLRWSPSRPLEREPKPSYADCSSFHEYRELLSGELRLLFANAADARRQSRYTPLATCSSGYDSTGALALARQLGCERAVTIATARVGGSDSAEEIGAALHVHVTPYARRDDADPDHVHEFFATGIGAGDIVYASFKPELDGALLLTGFLGDGVWSLDIPPQTVLERGDTSGMTLGEFRLASNFVHLPVPFIAGQLHPAIARISSSPEMAPYSVGGSYDRPIPRRLAEEAGVPRCAFGIQKKAVAIITRERHRQPPEFRAEVDRVMRSLSIGAKLASRVLIALHGPRRRMIRKLERKAAATRSTMLGAILLRARDLLGGDSRVFMRSNPAAAAEFCAAIAQVKTRYALAVSALDSDQMPIPRRSDRTRRAVG
jgi:hypothetical protein